MPDLKKPLPKNQREISRDSFTPYDGSGKPPANSEFKRAEERSFKNDNNKLPTVGLKDIDGAIIYYFDNVIRPSVVQNGNQVNVPILYGSPERWASVQKDGFYRDKNGKIQTPLIMFKRESIEKNRSLTNKLDANSPVNYGIYQKSYSSKNKYDRFSVLTNREPVKEYYAVVVPDFVNITYSCIIFTDYVEQMNKLVESINYASDSYWGDPERFKFRAMIDSYTTATELSDGADRAVKTTFNISLLGHIIPDSINAKKNVVNKLFSKSSINFGFEVISPSITIPAAGERFLTEEATTSRSAPADGASEALVSRAGTPERAASRRFFDKALTGVSGLGNGGGGGMTASQITFVGTVSTAVADTVATSTATFSNKSFLTPPNGFTVDQDSFTVYLNGVAIPTANRTVAESGSDIVVTFDTNLLEYELSSDDQVFLAGKFE